MDRRAKRLEKKRKDRQQLQKKAQVLAARKPSARELLMRSAARGEFGPCFVSRGWDDLSVPALVSVLVTRVMPSGDLFPALALVDRTCLGIKDAMVREPMTSRELAEFVEMVGRPHGGMVSCEPAVAQSMVFHAIDYARALGFQPHPDFAAALFGPPPTTLVSTPWCAPERPIYASGPRDNVAMITSRLAKAVGDAGFEYIDSLSLSDGDEATDDSFDDEELDYPIVHSPLERAISGDGVSLQILIYRGLRDTEWHLEVEDHLGGSTVWDGQFQTDQAALDAALLAIEEDGFENFVASSTAPAS